MSKVLIEREQLMRIHRDLDACQKVIWLAGGFDPAYCRDAQARLKEIDELLEQPAQAQAEPKPASAVADLKGWEKSLAAAWPADAEDTQGAWIIGAIDEDDNQYEVITVDAAQYDAPGESEKIARALITLWSQAFATTAAQPAVTITQAATDVLAERRRQIEAEGWTPEHDDEHGGGQIARAGACYALSGSCPPGDETAAMLVDLAWPWAPKWWRPTTQRRDLVKAAALVIAEIERLDRAALAGKDGDQ